MNRQKRLALLLERVDRLSDESLSRLRAWLGWLHADIPSMRAFEATLDPAKIKMVRVPRWWKCVEGAEPLLKIQYLQPMWLGG